jgi:hypothetical protein
MLWLALSGIKWHKRSLRNSWLWLTFLEVKWGGGIKILFSYCILSTLTTIYEYQWISFVVISEYVEAS